MTLDRRRYWLLALYIAFRVTAKGEGGGGGGGGGGRRRKKKEEEKKMYLQTKSSSVCLELVLHIR
jgi:hypothetical protein